MRNIITTKNCYEACKRGGYFPGSFLYLTPAKALSMEAFQNSLRPDAIPCSGHAGYMKPLEWWLHNLCPLRVAFFASVYHFGSDLRQQSSSSRTQVFFPNKSVCGDERYAQRNYTDRLISQDLTIEKV